jgi:hypothetical protein
VNNTSPNAGTHFQHFRYHWNMVEISIPVKPFVKQFLENKYGSPAFLTAKDPVGKYFQLLLTNNPHHRDKRGVRYKESIEIHVSSDQFFRYGFSLSATSVVWFNNFLEHLIKSELFMFLDFHVNRQNIPQKKAIELFMDEAGFCEDTWPFETIKKAHNRHRAKKNHYSENIHLSEQTLGHMSRAATR